MGNLRQKINNFKFTRNDLFFGEKAKKIDINLMSIFYCVYIHRNKKFYKKYNVNTKKEYETFL